MNPASQPMAARQVRLFPLDDIVLLPHGLLPLHIFEPRYRQMTEDALNCDRRITMVCPLKSSAGSETPALAPFGCVGRITHERRLPDGGFHLLLRGEARVRLKEEIPSDRLYRQARAQVLPEIVQARAQARRMLQRAEGIRLVRLMLNEGVEMAETFIDFLEHQCDSSAFADIIAFAAPLPPSFKLRLLGMADVDRRITVLLRSLAAMLADRSPPPGGWRYPPPFSVN